VCVSVLIVREAHTKHKARGVEPRGMAGRTEQREATNEREHEADRLQASFPVVSPSFSTSTGGGLPV
jgi:hypothetical protein